MSGGRPAPVRPDFDGSCLVNLVPSLLAGIAGPAAGAGPGPAAEQEIDLRPPEVRAASQVVLLVIDGLGALQLADHGAAAPVLSSGGERRLTSVAPSTTAVVLTSLTTGRPPAVHGVVGYRVAVDGSVMNVLRWTCAGRDVRRSIPPGSFAHAEPFSRPVRRRVPVVSRVEYTTTGFTAAHLGDAPLYGWSTPSGVVVETKRLLDAGEPFVYAYYDGLDRVAHARGVGEHYRAELVTCDRLVGDLLEVLPPGAALVVTADHGQVEVGPRLEVPEGDLMEMVALCSGEGRFRWFHAHRGAVEDLADAARQSYRDVAWVWTRDELIEEGWLGGEPAPAVADRLGDVAVVPFEPTAILDPADTGEQRLVGRHGSLTAAEMFVPLLSWARE